MLYTAPLHLIEDIHSKMKTLLSESNYQQQDLNTIKDDLGALKFGFAILQNITFELFAYSRAQNIRLQDIINTLSIQGEKIDALNTNITNHDMEVNNKLDQILDSMCPDLPATEPTTPESTAPTLIPRP